MLKELTIEDVRQLADTLQIFSRGETYLHQGQFNILDFPPVI